MHDPLRLVRLLPRPAGRPAAPLAAITISRESKLEPHPPPGRCPYVLPAATKGGDPNPMGDRWRPRPLHDSDPSVRPCRGTRPSRDRTARVLTSVRHAEQQTAPAIDRRGSDMHAVPYRSMGRSGL